MKIITLALLIATTSFAEISQADLQWIHNYQMPKGAAALEQMKMGIAIAQMEMDFHQFEREMRLQVQRTGKKLKR